MIKHTSDELSEAEKLLGIRNGRKVFLCTHESTKSSVDQHYELQFFDIFRNQRQTLLEALTTYPVNHSAEKPLQARVVVYRGFSLFEGSHGSSICVKRDHIKAAVFAQEDSYSQGLQHLNLMVFIASLALGNILSQQTLLSSHLKRPEFVRPSDQHHLLLVQSLLSSIVVNTGGLIDWLPQELPHDRYKTNGVCDGDFVTFDDEEDLLSSRDIKSLVENREDDDDEFYERLCREHTERVHDLFESLRLCTAWNPHGGGSLMDYSEENAPYYKEAVDDRIRIKFVEEIDSLRQQGS